jgi:hypothetical protein
MARTVADFWSYSQLDDGLMTFARRRQSADSTLALDRAHVVGRTSN